MPPEVYVAAGGGGDALGAAMLHRTFGYSEPPVIVSYAWERLLYDPLPGPRSASDFDRLAEPIPGLYEFTPETVTKPPARSPLPALIGLLGVRMFLLDPTGGQVALARQLRSLIEMVRPTQIRLVDVGGDILSAGTEPGLRSPLADTLAASACIGSQVPVRVVVAGPALDGELTRAEFKKRLATLRGRFLGKICQEAAESARPSFDIHPSEASRLLAAAALGYRGTVAIREQGVGILLDDQSADCFEFTLEALTTGSRLIRALVGATSLEEASEITRLIVGRSELDYERAKAKRPPPKTSTQRGTLEDTVSNVLRSASLHGADFITPRRVAELAGLRGDAASNFMAKLPSGDGTPLLLRTAETLDP